MGKNNHFFNFSVPVFFIMAVVLISSGQLCFGAGGVCENPVGDLNQDNIVDIHDLGVFVSHWLQNPCSEANGWCGGADLDDSNNVDLIDYSLLAQNWLTTGNCSPVVDAGYDQQITLPANAILDGTVTDDGLPNPPGVVTVTWTKQSGPGTVTFDDANATDTMVSFSAGGTYVLRLTVNDSKLSTYDEVTITVRVTIPPQWSESADYYVDGLSGSDGNPGSSSKPWATLIKAVSTAAAGKKVLVWGGQTYSSALTFNNSGTSTSPITFKHDPASYEAVIDGAGTTAGTLYTTNAKYIVIDGFTIQNGKYGVYAYGSAATNWTVKNCRITGNSMHGIYVRAGMNFDIFNNLVYGNANTGYGIYFYNSAINNNVTQCSVYKHKYGIEYDTSSSGTVTNSIVTKATSYGIYARSTSTVTVTYSDVWGNGTNYGGCSGGTGCISTDPKFVSPDTGDFHLGAGSPCDNTASDGGDMGYRYIDVNHRPLVNAGPDQTIYDPVNSANLLGAASDDGLPDPPGVVTTTWSKQSGPGTVTFDNANAVNTTATFSAFGTYVLRLTATDSELTSYDEVTIQYLLPPNNAPAVNAGPDQTIVYPDNGVNLDGTVTDDGMPNPPAHVTTQWTKQSGPGTVTFDDATAVDTTATFSDFGVYVLRLTANDSQLTSYDEVTITYLETPPPNQAPVVNAGPDQMVFLPAAANLDATVTDDGWPRPPTLTTEWTVQSGPGTVTFGNANAVDTTASFSTDGTYVLRLTANDGELTAYDEVTIIVNPEGTSPHYLKMVIHFHTSNSDGRETLEQMMLKYRDDPNMPRDVACVADHDYISNANLYTTSTFLGVNGVEATANGPHVVGFGMTLSPGGYSPGSDLQGHIDRIIAGGGLPIVAHPYWSYDYMGINILPMLQSMTNCNLIAVYNHYCHALWGNGISESYWDTLLSEGKVIWGIAEEDTHGWGNKCGFAVTMVDANAFTVAAIKSALTNGRSYFYVSNDRWKPHMTLAGYTVSGTTPGSTISIATANGVGDVMIKFIGNNGAVLKTVNGTYGSYTITGTENYVRIKINDSSIPAAPARLPTTIWTQPVFVTP